jgi:hypothetical protein
MSDPRFDCTHLEEPRRELYENARTELFDARGSVTAAFDIDDTRLLTILRACPILPRDVPYALFEFKTECFYPLRVGLTTIGRAVENNIILGENVISRRHCVVLVHATGGCELCDTASRNGTRVNGQPIRRVWLLEGDIVQLCHTRFMLAAAESVHCVFDKQKAEKHEAASVFEASVTGVFAPPATGSLGA